MISKVFKVFLVITVVSLVTVLGSIFLSIYIFFPSAFTKEQCELVERNFDKLKVGMTRKEVLPLIGGERRVSITYPPGEFLREEAGESLREQKNPWKVMALCTNPENDYEWYFIAFDTKTNKVVKIFSGWPDKNGFD